MKSNPLVCELGGKGKLFKCPSFSNFKIGNFQIRSELLQIQYTSHLKDVKYYSNNRSHLSVSDRKNLKKLWLLEETI